MGRQQEASLELRKALVAGQSAGAATRVLEEKPISAGMLHHERSDWGASVGACAWGEKLRRPWVPGVDRGWFVKDLGRFNSGDNEPAARLAGNSGGERHSSRSISTACLISRPARAAPTVRSALADRTRSGTSPLLG